MAVVLPECGAVDVWHHRPAMRPEERAVEGET
jgi:hypothetical protein